MDVRDITEQEMQALNKQGYTAIDLSLLAESEVKSLLVPERTDSEDDPHDAAAAAQDAAAQAAAAAAAAGQADLGAKAEGGNVASEAEANDDASAEPAPFVPQLKAEVPADAQQQIDKLKSEEAAAFKQMMDGDLEGEKYREVRERTDAAIKKLETATLTAAIFEQVNSQTAEQAAAQEWRRAEAAAFAQFKDEGLDYKGKPALLAAYNVHLKALANDPKNERRDAAWFLSEAHKQACADLGITPKRAAAPAPAPRGVDPQDVPPTLRGVPAAATNAVNQDEFVHLNNLSGMEYERAVAALSDAQRERWLNH